ncbi:Uncharacterized protein PODLI_1B003721, partial [Podarcis lilfordi]
PDQMMHRDVISGNLYLKLFHFCSLHFQPNGTRYSWCVLFRSAPERNAVAAVQLICIFKPGIWNTIRRTATHTSKKCR